MSFSLKYLFALVALVAVFTAALIYRTPFWTVFVVNITAIVLFVGTIGLWFERLNRTFWIPFCFVGWVYFIFAMTPQGISRVHAFLPGTQITRMINQMELALPRTTSQAEMEWQHRIMNLFDILNSCWVLIAATLAGVISVLLIRPKREA